MLLLIAPASMPWEHRFLGIILAMVCAFPSILYVATRSVGIPGFPLICMFYGLQFALPLFVIEDPRLEFAVGEVRVAPENVSASLALSILGVAAMQIGFYASCRLSNLRLLPVIKLPLDRRKSFRFAIFMSVSSVTLNLAMTAGILSRESVGSLFQVVLFLIGQIYIAIAILVWLSYDELYARKAKLALVAVVMAAMGMGMIRGEMETLLIPIVALVMARWAQSHRPPWRLAVIGLALFLIFQPVKAAYREKTWWSSSNAQNLPMSDRLSLWAELLVTHWGQTLTGTGTSLRDAVSPPFVRADLQSLFAYTYSLTPSIVPFQNGSTYSYLVISWIPRFVWPNKPLAQEANKNYAVAYGIQTEEGTETSMVGLAIMIEAFVNFGAIGVGVVMAIQGVIVGVMDRLLNHKESGIGGRCIFMGITALLLNSMGSNTGAMLGGLVQVVGCSYLLVYIAKEQVATAR